MNECCDIDQLIVNAAIRCDITFKPLCTFWASVCCYTDLYFC